MHRSCSDRKKNSRACNVMFALISEFLFPCMPVRHSFFLDTSVKLCSKLRVKNLYDLFISSYFFIC